MLRAHAHGRRPPPTRLLRRHTPVPIQQFFPREALRGLPSRVPTATRQADQRMDMNIRTGSPTRFSGMSAFLGALVAAVLVVLGVGSAVGQAQETPTSAPEETTIAPATSDTTPQDPPTTLAP